MSLNTPEQKPSPMEVELSKIAEEKWGRFKDVFKPAEDKFIEKTDKIGSQAERDKAAGVGTASVQEQMGSGLNPTAKNLINRESARRGGITKGTTSADVVTDTRKNKADEAVIGLGKNIENTGLRGMSRTMGQQEVQQQARLDAGATRSGLASEAGGMALGYGLYRPNEENSQNNRNRSGGLNPNSPYSASDNDYWRTA